MNERSVHPIASARAPETSGFSKINLSDKEGAAGVRESISTDTSQSTHKAQLRNDFTENLTNISIHFNVDNETQRLVAVVTERKSGRVIRTIPASEFKKMQAGDLLKLKA